MYRYLEFYREECQSPKLYFVFDDVYSCIDEKDELVQELDLRKEGSHSYYTTLANMGKKGWELAFVAPYGDTSGFQTTAGIIHQTFIFKKKIDDVIDSGDKEKSQAKSSADKDDDWFDLDD